ncbi:MAG: hypothetical protein ACOZQL_34860 [Myxococcota bacterium]
MRGLGSAVLFVFAACSAPPVADAAVELDAGEEDAGIDAGPRDPGYDIPPSEWIDGGLGDTWGCYGRSRDRFIARFETRDGSDLWCASVLFKRQDGGFAPLFPDFDGPDGFQIADARWAIVCDSLELDNGELNHVGTRPVHDFHGSLELSGFHMNRPYVYFIDAGIRVAYRVYQLKEGGNLSADCRGP